MSARVARRQERRQMPLRQLAWWMKMVRPLALSRGPSGRRLPGTLQRQPRPNATRERPKPERMARLPSVAGQERAADVTLAPLLLWHVGTADRNAAQSRYSLRGWLSALLSQRCIYQMFVRGNCRNSAGPSQRVPPTGQVTVRFAAQHPDICHRGGHLPCQRKSYAGKW
jgi:hypothetical protein